MIIILITYLQERGIVVCDITYLIILFLQIEVTITFVTLSFVAAIPFWILIDAPLTELLKYCLILTNTEKKADNIDDDEDNVICLNKRNDISVDDNEDVNA